MQRKCSGKEVPLLKKRCFEKVALLKKYFPMEKQLFGKSNHSEKEGAVEYCLSEKLALSKK